MTNRLKESMSFFLGGMLEPRAMVTFHSRKEQDTDFRKELARLSSLVADMEAIGR